jgi:branched-chain amino acid transport system ATP-binding protein
MTAAVIEAAAAAATTDTAPAGAGPVLAVKNIAVIYDHVILVLRGVSFEVAQGRIVALLGGNGAGKSTTLKSISTLLASERGQVTKGSIEFRGRRVDQLAPGDLVGMGMVQVMEGRHCFAHLTVEDNLITGAYTRPIRGADLRDALERVYAYFPRLKVRRASLAGYTSGGELLLDEPSMGLAPQMVAEIFEIVRELNRKEGVSILLAEQNTNVALKYADHGYILESGRIMMDGPARMLAENKDVKEFYLGLSSEGRQSFRDMKSYRRRKRWI